MDRWVSYLDGGLGQVEGGSQLTSSRPGHVILAVELLLKSPQLFSRERCAVTSNGRVLGGNCK